MEAADHAWSNGVFFSNGNYALRHLGIPSVTVAMGVMSDIGMPVGLTFAGAAYSDPALLGYAAAFEGGASGTLRRPPASTPALPEDRVLPGA
jgi:amidase